MAQKAEEKEMIDCLELWSHVFCAGVLDAIEERRSGQVFDFEGSANRWLFSDTDPLSAAWIADNLKLTFLPKIRALVESGNTKELYEKLRWRPLRKDYEKAEKGEQRVIETLEQQLSLFEA